MKNIFYIFFMSFAFLACRNEVEETTKPQHAVFENPVLKPLTEAIKADPQNAENYYQRSILLNKLGQEELTLEDLRTAIRLDTANVLYLESLALFFLNSNAFDSALHYTHQLQQKDGEKLSYSLYETEALIGAHDITTAQKIAEKLYGQYPNHPSVFLNDSKVKVAAKDTNAALRLALEAVKVKPDFYDGLYQVADLYSAQKDKTAILWYQKIYRLDTINAQPLYDAGLFYENIHDIPTAKSYYIKAISADKDFTEAYLNYGKILLSQDSVEKAQRQFHIATQVAPSNADAYYYKGFCAEKIGKNTEAIALYKQALLFDKKHAEAAAHLKKLSVK